MGAAWGSQTGPWWGGRGGSGPPSSPSEKSRLWEPGTGWTRSFPASGLRLVSLSLCSPSHEAPFEVSGASRGGSGPRPPPPHPGACTRLGLLPALGRTCPGQATGRTGSAGVIPPSPPAVSLGARVPGPTERVWSRGPERGAQVRPGRALEAGTPGGAGRPVSQGHPRAGAPSRYPGRGRPAARPAGPGAARPGKTGRASAARSHSGGGGGRPHGLKGAAAARTQPLGHAWRGPRGRAAGAPGLAGLGAELGRRGAGRGQGGGAAGLSLRSAAHRGLSPARWVQWFLTVQQFCSAIVKCLGPLDPAGPAATATGATQARPGDWGRGTPAGRSPAPRCVRPGPD